MNTTMSLVNPFVDRWRAARSDSANVEEHIHWNVTYATRPVEAANGNIWPVVGTLHAAGVGGWGDVSVAGLIRNAESVSAEDFESELGASEAIETLYDFARSHFLPLLAGVGAELTIPLKSPNAAMMPFDPDLADEDDNEA